MKVDCPECAASLDGSPGSEMVCPACMTPFLVPAAEKAVRVFEVMAAGDSSVQLLSRHAIREAIYVGRLNAAARVRPTGGKWELIGGYPEFAGVFRMMGGDLAPMAGTRKLAGWRRSGGERTDPLRTIPPRDRTIPPEDNEPTTEAAPRPVVPAPAPAPPAPAPRAAAPPAAPVGERSGLTTVLLVLGGLVAAGLLAFLLFG